VGPWFLDRDFSCPCEMSYCLYSEHRGPRGTGADCLLRILILGVGADGPYRVHGKTTNTNRQC